MTIRNILILYFFCAGLSGYAFCQEKIEIDSQVISVNPDKEYIVIKAGENQGVEIGDGLIVHREGDKLAEAQIIEVRTEVSAAEILNSYKEIKEGDEILIVKETGEPRAIKKEKVYREPKRSKWTTLLGAGAEAMPTAPVEAVTSDYAGGVEPLGQDEIHAGHERSAVRAVIGADPNTVFSYGLIVLREEGYSVTLSNRTTGTILATEAIELSLVKELWADAMAVTEHKLVVSLKIKDNGEASELNAAGFREHVQKGKRVKLPIAEGSRYHSDLVKLASKIKERAER